MAKKKSIKKGSNVEDDIESVDELESGAIEDEAGSFDPSEIIAPLAAHEEHKLENEIKVKNFSGIPGKYRKFF